MTDVPSLEPGAIHNNILFILGIMDQQGTSSQDGKILLIYYSVDKTIPISKSE